MSERQEAIAALYAAYSNAGDDDMNARARVLDDAAELGIEVSDGELDLAQARYADVDDLEDLVAG
jgi:hypothetical protein